MQTPNNNTAELAAKAAEITATLAAANAAAKELTQATMLALYTKLKAIFATPDTFRLVLDKPVEMEKNYGWDSFSQDYDGPKGNLYLCEINSLWEDSATTGGYDSYSYNFYNKEPEAVYMVQNGLPLTAARVLDPQSHKNLVCCTRWHSTGKYTAGHLNPEIGYTLAGAYAKVLEALETGAYTVQDFRKYPNECTACGETFLADDCERDQCPECNGDEE